MSENQKEPQYKLRWNENLRNDVMNAAKENNRSINQEIIVRLEQSFSQNKNDFKAGYSACMAHMVLATSKVLSEKGIPWEEVQKTLVDVIEDFQKIASEKKSSN
ncbi:Arc family DNA-binding protein [Acinetobacter sp. 102]|uniref:Arc family DNA-binding protein n=1 Tax=Acinetobacter sp. 102 TaxID=3098766 RepID=UPI00300AAE75